MYGVWCMVYERMVCSVWSMGAWCMVHECMVHECMSVWYMSVHGVPPSPARHNSAPFAGERRQLRFRQNEEQSLELVILAP